jgi:hypothetical protein
MPNVVVIQMAPSTLQFRSHLHIRNNIGTSKQKIRNI